VIDFIDMEESRNRREVENRLRDALRQDRARVQFGSISKFGLMEMSRQRLKPALSEGSSIPCPRCGGSGHVRDTESSALQILRIIQEESMKDNTAAVHAQVPVEVASFLLNEKRPEIAKIELKQRINVLLVPNKSLETPHYKLERLKHDDPRLDHIEASYTMAEEVEDPTTVTRRSQEPTNRQTPVIKGVLPDAPAPASLPKAETTKTAKPQDGKAATKSESTGGFFGWLKRLISGNTEAKAEPAAKNVGKRGDRTGKDGERSERGERNGERRGGRGGRGGRRGDRTDRGERSDTERNDKGERSETTETRAPRENGGNRRGGERNERTGQRGERRENANNNAAQSVDASNVSADSSELNNPENRNESRAERAPRGEGRRERGEGRRERGERGDRRHQDGNRQNAAAENSDNLAPAQTLLNDNANADAVNQGDERTDGANGTPERRERRSRDRYGRDRRERNNGTDNNASDSGITGATDSVAPEPSGTEEVPVTRSYFDRAASVAPATTAQAPATSSSEPVSTPAPTAAPATTTASASASAPASNATSSLPKVQSYVLPMASLIEVAEGSGLKWVNSDPEKIAQAQAAIAAEPKPVHVPRERPPAVVFDEGPLVLVETRKDLSNMNLPF
jgi:ribonuclease E